MRSIAVTFLFSMACARPCPTPSTAPVTTTATTATAAAIGETFVIPSKILGEDRVVNVYVPPGYAEGTETYPVLYMPDGGLDEDFPHVSGEVDVSIKNAVIRPMIVVGVKNTERRRDLVPATTVDDEKKIAPHAGGADKFRAFLRDELKPWVAARYRVTAESALIGESFAGLFVIETLVTEPTLFDAYIAVDPSVWWNKGAVIETAKARFADWHEAPKTFFVATADYKETQDGVAALLEHVPAGIAVHYVPMPEEHHSTIFPFAALRGVRTLFAMPPEAK
jgi:uncharacterized protein